MSDIEWGEPIAVDGKRPEWLRDDENIFITAKDGYETDSLSHLFKGSDFDWWTDDNKDRIVSIRLPKHHWAYLTDRDDRRVDLSKMTAPGRRLQLRIWEAEKQSKQSAWIMTAEEYERHYGIHPDKKPWLQNNPYHHLSTVLDEALSQASEGKGRERHAQDLPFHEQPMQQLIDLYGMGFALGQAGKKMQESQRLPHDAARNELLGAIVYIAGAIVAMDRGCDEASENGE